MLSNFLYNLTQPDQPDTAQNTRVSTHSNTEDHSGSISVAPESNLNAVQFFNPETMAPTHSAPVTNMADPFNLPPGLQGPMDGIALPDEAPQSQTFENFVKDLMPDNYTGLLFTTANSLAKAVNWVMDLWYDNNAAQGGQTEQQDRQNINGFTVLKMIDYAVRQISALTTNSANNENLPR